MSAVSPATRTTVSPATRTTVLTATTLLVFAANTAMIESGFSIRIHGMRFCLTSSSLTRTVALVSAAVPVNSVSPWLA